MVAQVYCEVPGCAELATRVLYWNSMASYNRFCLCEKHYDQRKEL